MGEIDRFLEQWEMDVPGVHRRLILAPTPRERERRHAVWPLALGSGLERLGHRRALRRDPHTIGRWLAAFGQGGPAALVFEQSGGSPLEEAQQAELKAAVQEPPAASGIGLTNWNWKAVRQFVLEHFGISLSRSSCLNCLHRLGFAFKRPKKRLLKADAEKREAFVSEYAALVEEAQGTGEKIFNADEAIWGWAREEATGNLCLGSKAAVQERVGSFLAGLTSRKDEVKRRCRIILQSRTEGLRQSSRNDSRHTSNAHPTLALV